MRQAVVLALVVGIGSSLSHAADRSLWLAVTTEQLAPSIQPLAERRRSEGLDAVVVVGDPSIALRDYPRPAYLLLVGDAPGPVEAADPAWHVPAVEMPLYRWRAEQRTTFASDSKWGELDGDELPDVPVGRIPARTPEEVAAVVANILAYEDRPWTVDDLRFPMWQGSPNYGPAIDSVAVTLINTIVDTTVPRWGEPSLIAGLPASPYCGWPIEHAATFNRWLRRGGMMAIVGAHGNQDSFFSMAFQDEWIGYQTSDVDRDLQTGPPTCPLILVSCSTGNFAGANPCLAEALLFAPGGPVAVAGATTESHPLTNLLHGLAMVRGFDAGPQRLGDFWLAGVRGLHTERQVMFEMMLANVEGEVLEPTIDVEKLRRDQAWMYALLGDPATRLRLPGKLSAKIEQVGNAWRWSVEPPPSAEKLEVGVRAPIRQPAVPGPPVDVDSAQQAQEQANAAFSYKPHVTLSADQPWEGEVDVAGDIRLLVTAPNQWWVAVLKAGD